MRPDTQSWADLEERLRLALRAQTKIRKYANNLDYEDQFRGIFETFRINMMHLSLFVHWDLADLRNAVRKHGDVLYRMLNNIEPFLANMLAYQSKDIRDAQEYCPDPTPDPVDNLPSSSLQATPPSGDRTPGLPGPYDVKGRNQDTIEIASVRDSRKCVVTNKGQPQMCHIVPYALNHTIHRALQLAGILEFVAQALNDKLGRDLDETLCEVDEETGQFIRGCSDIPANILALLAHLHVAWGKARFLLEWLGADDEPSTFSPVVFEGTQKERKLQLTKFRLRWHWLPTTTCEALSIHQLDDTSERVPRRQIRLESESDIAAIRNTIVGAGRSPPDLMFYEENGRPIESGHIITCHAQTVDLDKTRKLIKLQEIAWRMASMSGAADFAEYLDKDARPDPEFTAVIPEGWEERLAERTAEIDAEIAAEKEEEASKEEERHPACRDPGYRPYV